jgi:hypothetical protein
VPFTINVEDIPELRAPIDRAREQGREKGIQQGRARILLKLLETRFPDSTSPDIQQVVGHLDEAQSDGLARRLLTASSLTEALGDAALHRLEGAPKP